MKVRKQRESGKKESHVRRGYYSDQIKSKQKADNHASDALTQG